MRDLGTAPYIGRRISIAATCFAPLLAFTSSCEQTQTPSSDLSSASSATSSGSGGSGGSAGSSAGGSGSGSQAGTLSVNIDAGSGDSGDGSIDGCATHTEQAAILPVHLIILMDQSGSMGDGSPMNDPATRWTPVTTALKGFFSDPASAGLDASMIMFPGNLNTTTDITDGQLGEQCDITTYSTPTVPVTPLPSPAFGAALDMLTPPNEYGTPTQPALVGAIQYAQAQQVANPDRKVVIVMVTDGEPTTCFPDNNIENAADEVEAVAAEIPTYVIGVGDALENLNAIAEAGGTEAAILVAVDNPAATQADLTAAINEIRGKVIACNMTLPLPPDGETLDPMKVNVAFTPGGGTPTNLPYDPACTNGEGWRYDSETAPTEIVLCDSTCGTVSADTAAAVNVVLGCQRIVR